MRTYRFVVNDDQVVGRSVRITGQDARQIRAVLRLGVGGRLEIVHAGNCCSAIITELKRDSVLAELLSPIPARADPAVRITLAQAVPKGGKLDWIVQKGSELGLHEFVLIGCRRCVRRLTDERASSRISRLRRIAKEAAEQCGRTAVPEIRGVLSLEDLLREAGEYDLALLCWEGQGAEMLGSVLEKCREVQSILLIVGPEGGFAQDEFDAAVQAGVVPVSLGSRLLRCETAALAASAIIVHEFERRESIEGQRLPGQVRAGVERSNT